MGYNCAARLKRRLCIFGIILALSFSIAYLPQILKMWKNKSSEDVSLWMLIINTIGYMSGVLYLLVGGATGFWLWINYSLGTVMSLIAIGFWISYRR